MRIAFLETAVLERAMKKVILVALVALGTAGIFSAQFLSNKPHAAPAIGSISTYDLTLAASSLPSADSVGSH
jgi:hypothetical protein